jgi:redox-sensitive bicupin YhaK (pirin superfamily)
MGVQMFDIRRADDRGHFDHGWLNTYHTFSFGGYQDPDFMGFRSLRVINEDRVQPGQGFGTHPHKDMEIITYVLEGTLQHEDSMGNCSEISAGDVQRMTAGTGIMHSEYNASDTKLVHFLQIWINPDRRGLEPSYQQMNFSREDKLGKMNLIASQSGRDGSLTINQDVSIYAAVLEPTDILTVPISEGRHLWLHVARGTIRANSQLLSAGDGAGLANLSSLELISADESEVLLFDLA